MKKSRKYRFLIGKRNGKICGLNNGENLDLGCCSKAVKSNLRKIIWLFVGFLGLFDGCMV